MPLPTLNSVLKKAKDARNAGPVWKGPEVDGVTQSLLGGYLSCKERFRLHVIEGITSADVWNHRMGYGNMWHVCEEYFAQVKTDLLSGASWVNALTAYTRAECKKYPLQQQEISKWYKICLVQFPIYVKYWSKHKDVIQRTPLLQEEVFNVLYALPSGRTVRLRGKWDSVDLLGKNKGAGVYVKENKTKSDINERQIKRQLTFDLQTMTYLAALTEETRRLDDSSVKLKASYRDGEHRKFYPILGVTYNVVKRPRQYQGKKETEAQFLERLKGIIEESPEEFFMRWKCEVSSEDVLRFRCECLDPILENLLDDYEWWTSKTAKGGVYDYSARKVAFPEHLSRHHRLPYGVYNPLSEGGSSEVDEYLHSGSMVGLRRTDNLFPELTDA